MPFKLENKKIKNIAAVLASIWTFGSPKDVQSQEPEGSPLPTTHIEELGIIDIFPETIGQSNTISNSEVEELLLSNLKEWYSNAQIGDTLTQENIPLIVKQLITQRYLVHYIDHGANMTIAIEHVLRYFNHIPAQNTLSIPFADLRESYDFESIRLEKFEDVERGVRGIRFRLDKADQHIIDFLNSNPQINVLNMSFQVGEVVIELIMEKMEEKQTYLFILNDGTEVFTLIPFNSYVTIVEDGVSKLVPGDENSNPIPYYTYEELDEHGIELGYKNLDQPEIKIYEPYSEQSNRDRLNRIALSFPNIIFVNSAGNQDSFSLLAEAPNILTVGMFYNNIVGTITGSADIYINEIAINQTGLRYSVDGVEKSINSSSEAAAILTAIIRILREQNPEWSAELLREYFLDKYVNYSDEIEIFIGNPLFYDDRTGVTRERRILPLLDLEKLLLDYSQTPIPIDQEVLSQAQEDI